METKLSTQLLRTVAINVAAGASVVTGIAIGYGTLEATNLNPFVPTPSCPTPAMEREP